MRYVDAHAHLGSWPTKEEAERALLSSMDAHDIEFSLLSHADAEEFLEDGQEAENVSSQKRLEELLSLVERHPKRFGALLWIRPFHERIDDSFLSFYQARKSAIYGLKFHPFSSRVSIGDPRMEEWYAFAEKEGLPILVHTAMDPYSSILYLFDVAKRHPSLKIIAGHMELCSDHELALRLLQECPNVYGDTCWVDFPFLQKGIASVGSERFLFGTDNPIDGEFTLDNPLYRPYFSASSFPRKEEKEALMRKNAIQLFSLPLSLDGE